MPQWVLLCFEKRKVHNTPCVLWLLNYYYIQVVRNLLSFDPASKTESLTLTSRKWTLNVRLNQQQSSALGVVTQIPCARVTLVMLLLPRKDFKSIFLYSVFKLFFPFISITTAKYMIFKHTSYLPIASFDLMVKVNTTPALFAEITGHG